MTTTQTVLAALLGSLSLICPMPVFAQSKSITLTVDDYRPLDAAVLEIEKISGLPIHYEDMRCDFAGDELDITPLIGVTPAQLALHGSVKDVVPRGGPLAAMIAVDASTGRLLDAEATSEALNAVVSAYNAPGTLPGQFEVVRANGAFFVEPTAVRNSSGQTVPIRAILSTPITIPAEERIAADTLNLILAQVSQLSGFKVSVGEVPMNALAMTRGAFSASQEPACQVLGRFLNSLVGYGAVAPSSSPTLAYRVFYDVQLRYYMFSVVEVGYVGPRYLPTPPAPPSPGPGRPGLNPKNP